MSQIPLYPLKFSPIYKDKVWGGRTLEKIGRTLPGDAKLPIGEAWEIADLASTSVSGGGGGEARSVVANGPLAGKSLNQLMKEYGPLLMGGLAANELGQFPLLVKYLDARENLSVQVHPSPDYAKAHPEVHLKSEAWYIVQAEPGAAIYKGLQSGVTPDDVRRAIAANDQQAIEKLLVRIPVKAGDCHYLPSGTCHALGAGVLVAEAQTPSDTTFRVYDWGREKKGGGRELHLEPSIQCMTFGPAETARYEKRSHIANIFTTVSRLVMCEFFSIEKVRMSQGYQQEIPYDQPVIWMVLQGRGTITTADAPPVTFAQGDTMLIPAKLNQTRVLLDEDTVWLEIGFPQAQPVQLA